MAGINLTVVDLSPYDAVTDLAAAKNAGIAGIIHKASQGPLWQDPTYTERRAAAAAAGMLWGAYHFGTSAPVAQQVANFINTAQPDANTLMAFDFEPNGGDTMTLEQARQFLALVAVRIGRKPVISPSRRRVGASIGYGNTAAARAARSRARSSAFRAIRTVRSTAILWPAQPRS